MSTAERAEQQARMQARMQSMDRILRREDAAHAALRAADRAGGTARPSLISRQSTYRSSTTSHSAPHPPWSGIQSCLGAHTPPRCPAPRRREHCCAAVQGDSFGPHWGLHQEGRCRSGGGIPCARPRRQRAVGHQPVRARGAGCTRNGATVHPPQARYHPPPPSTSPLVPNLRPDSSSRYSRTRHGCPCSGTSSRCSTKRTRALTAPFDWTTSFATWCVRRCLHHRGGAQHTPSWHMPSVCARPTVPTSDEETAAANDRAGEEASNTAAGVTSYRRGAGAAREAGVCLC